jgi:hypothetical protein
MFFLSPTKEKMDRNMELKKVMPVVIFLLLLPFIMSFGTNIPIVLMAYQHIMPWFAFCILMSMLGITVLKLDYKFHFILPTLALFFAWSYFLGIFMFSPVRGIIYQNYQVTNVEKLKHMRVDYSSKKFIEDTYNIMIKAGFKKGDDLIALDIPFFAYAFEANSPGASWYSVEIPQNNCKILASIHSRLKNAYFILPSTIDPAFFRCIKSYGIFENHKLAGYSVVPYDIYSIKKGTKLAFFVPVKDKVSNNSK